jgi:hypothetical protein
VSVLEIDDQYPDQLFADFGLHLAEVGVATDPEGDPAGFGDGVSRLWHGAQEATRQLTYRRLERRAEVVGRYGLGPMMARLQEVRSEISLNLVGHGLGAALVAHALPALPESSAEGRSGSRARIRSVTLLQAVLPDTAFADKLPHDSSSPGVLAGMDERVAGAVTACYSRYDTSLARFHPLAARTTGPDDRAIAEAAAETTARRWGVLGHHGHRPVSRELPLNRPGVPYDLAGQGLVAIDASRVVRRGRPPHGAHADVCHPELAWVALNAAGLC